MASWGVTRGGRGVTVLVEPYFGFSITFLVVNG